MKLAGWIVRHTELSLQLDESFARTRQESISKAFWMDYVPTNSCARAWKCAYRMGWRCVKLYRND